MKLRKFISILLVALLLFSAVPAYAFGTGSGYENISRHLYYAEICFRDGIGPETDGYSIDYRYFSPVKAEDTTKYPLVIWLHGFGNGSNPGSQLAASDIEAWGTAELQQRFRNSGGAFILAPRSPEDKKLYWDNCLIRPLCAAIEDFVDRYKDNIDPGRIYIGGHSMGGWMTLKMAVAYPEMFAAIFPVCPAWKLDSKSAERLADIPIWLTSATKDHLVSYKMTLTPTWKRIISESNVPEKCRFSTISASAYPDGEATPNEHQSWFSVNYDMFSSEDGDYPNMSTVDGNGHLVELNYPDGIISWLSDITGDYDGSSLSDSEPYIISKGSGIFRLYVALFTFYRNLYRRLNTI